MGKVPLEAAVPQTTKSTKTLVKHFMVSGKWNLEKLQKTLPDHLVKHIETIDIGRQNLQDQVYWDLTDNGKYNNKSAWQQIRSCKPKNHFLHKVWHNSIPFKFSFLTWRLWQGKLPFDEVTTKFGNQAVSRYNCCRNPDAESMLHVLVKDEAANFIFKLFSGPLGIKYHQGTIRSLINSWWQ
ncbi:uncharacterized protein [Nicotiana tomentosiformis]|uniref:uncharacterized protein n=1 Tax=Nicotiana tomentosiformis TaxID=4098 RepID=UPI00388CC9C5